MDSPRSTAPPTSPRHYNKFNYAARRTPEGVGRGAAPSSPPSPQREPATKTVLEPLRRNVFGFAVAEDGIMHCRVVTPPRKCFAPIILELNATEAEANGVTGEPPLWTQFKRATGLTSDEDVAVLEWRDIEVVARDELRLPAVDIARLEVTYKKLKMGKKISANVVGLGGPATASNGKTSATMAEMPLMQPDILKPPATPLDFAHSSSMSLSNGGAGGGPSSPAAVSPHPMSQQQTQRPSTPRSVGRPFCSATTPPPLSFSGLIGGSMMSPSVLGSARRLPPTNGPFVASPVAHRKKIFSEKLQWRASPKIDSGSRQGSRSGSTA